MQVIQTQQLGKQVRLANNARSSITSDNSGLSILSDINLSIEKGQSVAITGASGSGKTTLLGILAGLDSATSGDIELLGQSMAGLNEDQRAALRKSRVGFVFQSFQLLEHLSAVENVLLPLELDESVKQAKSQAEQALQQVGLGERMNHLARQLSGGEQQRVALARAFVTQPEILFADEPTGNLDSHTGEEVIQLLFDMQKQSGTTLVLVTHDDDLAKRCDVHYRLQDGVLHVA